ncbi:MAG: DUF4124 domain-containing protein [Sedimenticola sp.]|nr:DUF4124 domain-containing protein [Sedimenticola sp.]
MMRLLFGLIILMIHLNTAAGEIYKWVDDQGKTHFSDSKPVTQTAESVELKINSYTQVTYELSPNSSVASGNPGAKAVVMYSTRWCGYCKKAKRFFKSKGIPFKEYDIEKSAAARKAYDKLGGRGVPVILVGSSRMNGFSEEGFMKLYRG